MDILNATLIEWVAEKSKNDIKQHSDVWIAKKKYTIGGSSLATLMGTNPYSNERKMCAEKIGICARGFMGAAPQWGNLFEELVKLCVEHAYNCVIHGENLYIEGAADTYTAYSPDGLSACAYDNRPQIVLWEFKCPYSRIPTSVAPAAYVAQVRMGLDMLHLPTVGVLAEAVFRKCVWDDLGSGPGHIAATLVEAKKPLRLPTIAYGFVGFYMDSAAVKERIGTRTCSMFSSDCVGVGVNDDIVEEPDTAYDGDLATTRNILFARYVKEFGEFGSEKNEYMSNDLGTAPKLLFEYMLECYSKQLLIPWYGHVNFVDAGTDDVNTLNSDLESYTEFCALHNYTNFGILPWKLLDIKYHTIAHEPGYLEPWLPKIKSLIEFVIECDKHPAKKMELFDRRFVTESVFDDGL